MKPIKVKFKKGERDLSITGDLLVENMENNPSFPNPPQALADLKTLLPEYHAALLDADRGDKAMVSIKNDKKAVVLDRIQQVADYVTAISKGDRTIILLSGFDVTGERRSSGQPPVIKTLEVELGLSGEATIRSRDIKSVKSYVHQYCTEAPGPNTVWVNQYSSQGTYTFKGLSSEKRHWFRVIAVGRNEQLSYSPIVSKVIQ
jgi:hypothetical protein